MISVVVCHCYCPTLGGSCQTVYQRVSTEIFGGSDPVGAVKLRGEESRKEAVTALFCHGSVDLMGAGRAATARSGRGSSTTAAASESESVEMLHKTCRGSASRQGIAARSESRGTR